MWQWLAGPSCWKQRQVFPKRNGRARARQCVKKCLQCSASPVTLTQIPARSPAAAPLAPPRQRSVRCSAPCSRAVQQQRLAPRRRRSAPATCSKLSREPPPGFPSGVRTHQNRLLLLLLLQGAAERVVRAQQSKALSRGVAQAGRSSSSSSRAVLLLLLLSNPCHNHDSRLPCHSPQKRWRHRDQVGW